MLKSPTIASPGVSYSLIGHLSATELDTLANGKVVPGQDLTWFKSFDLPGGKLEFTSPSRGVTLYRVCYEIDTETKRYGRQVVSGLVAIPDGDEAAQPRHLPLVMYNHGTVFNRNEVPSNVVFRVPDGNGAERWQIGSGETFFQLCRLVDAGYALIAPDYIGLGVSTDPIEGYSVKEITNQATLGLLEASRSILSDLDVRPIQLFHNGWSQGSLNTQWLTQMLQELAVPVAATALQSPMNEWLGSFRWASTLNMQQNGPKNINQSDPAPWLPLAMGRAIGSYETWYDLPGLLDAILKDKPIPDRQFDANGNLIDDPNNYTYALNPYKLTYRQVIKAFISDYGYIESFLPDDFNNQIWHLSLADGTKTTVPGFTNGEMLIDGLFAEQQSDLISNFLRRLEINSPRYWDYATPVRAWYGLSDEALPVNLVDPDMAIFGGSKVSLVPVAGASHRMTFLNSLYASPENKGGTTENLLAWFELFLRGDADPPQLVLSDNSLSVESEHFGLLPLLLKVDQQQGERALQLQILRVRSDGRSEVVGSVGGTTAVAGQLQTLGDGRLMLQVGERLKFELLSRDGSRIDASRTEIAPRPGGGYSVIVRDDAGGDASLRFHLQAADQAFAPASLDRIAAPQGSATAGLLQLSEGQRLDLEVTTDSAFVNRLGFVRLNLDPITGLPTHTVGPDQIAINSESFRANIESLLDPGFQHQQGGRMVQSGLQWLVEQTGIYAPVLITPQGNVYADAGDPGEGARHLRVLGHNVHGFEDLDPLSSDWDCNDLVFKIVGVT